ncbi:low temperature requirement protein LtrA [Saprolegnia diclina VS20]|uniref:Low temperature requirement protein LtrA n=1 Tax=Saprolegnia diclina (strain VS20) TaxID=1156394 RepID=T0RLQ0_SAPDV|nr:low temperature requirement protein LtrA [Saprolegnia diclina VS20]EQC33243.1 low temperature requirement protein LtrA [Saprolegnia diclina VS20]|eukprot:XP_008613366.1 low temperature requirement protein LtrA [Saprolegnia diclina VS20]
MASGQVEPVLVAKSANAAWALEPVRSKYTLERTSSLHHSVFHTPMTGRDPKERNRKSTPLEKLFDLTLVVALSAVSNVFATSMQHGDNLFQNTVLFIMLFFAVWNAWLPFTWFASMYDVDDALYRLATLGQMVGLLVVTDGIKYDKSEVIAGYVILRLSLEGLLRGRAAIYDVRHRHLTVRSMAASCTVLVGWVVLFQATLSEEMFEAYYFVLGLLDIALPSLVAHSNEVRFHAHHISERYAEFTIIIFGECLLSLSHATVLHGAHGFSYDALAILIGSMLLLFLLWWFYFFIPFGHVMDANPAAAFRIGIGHFVIHCALAAFATGLYMIAHLANEHDASGSSSGSSAPVMSTQTASLMVAIPIGLFLFALALVAGLSWAAVARSVGVGAAEVLIGVYVTPLVSLPALVFLYCVPMTLLLLEVMWMEGGAEHVATRSEPTSVKEAHDTS